MIILSPNQVVLKRVFHYHHLDFLLPKHFNDLTHFKYLAISIFKQVTFFYAFKKLK